MTRRTVYGLGLFVTIASTAMTITTIVLPRWISPTDPSQPTLGLHKSCSRQTGTCSAFPRPRLCAQGNFCHAWRTVGFLVSFAVVVELATLVAFAVIMAGGVQRRVAGWRIITALLAFGGVVQCGAMSIVAYLFDHSPHFSKGWYLDASWSLCATSSALLLLTALAITASALYLPEEGDYELIPDYPETQQDEQLQSRIAGWNDGYGSGRSYEN